MKHDKPSGWAVLWSSRLFRWVNSRDLPSLWPPGLWFGGHAWRWWERIQIVLGMPLSAWWHRWRRSSYFLFERQLEPFPPALLWLFVATLLLWLLLRAS